jgi:hypothetical protein
MSAGRISSVVFIWVLLTRTGAKPCEKLEWAYNSEAMDRQISETTGLLRAWAGGDRGALDRHVPRVYEELRRMAQSFMRHERAGRTIQATALVHEAYLRLIDIETWIGSSVRTSLRSARR